MTAPPTPDEAEAHRRHFLEIADTLDSLIAGPAEPGSVLDQLAHQNAGPEGLEIRLRVVTTQGTEFLRSSLRVVEPPASGVTLSPIAPLARAALLAFSKVISISTPLNHKVRDLGPAMQHYHDSLIEMIAEQDRHAMFAPTSNQATLWQSRGRAALLARLADLRTLLGEKPVKAKGPGLGDTLVSETSWIVDAQTRCIEIETLEGAPRDQFMNRMRWAWHRASISAHAGFASEVTPAGVELVYLSPQDASDLIRAAAELAAAAQRVMDGVWSALQRLRR